ncbi:hypothetical protein [Serratia sp. BW106]|nr:hypothetical protein [Serratia sp. BW106]
MKHWRDVVHPLLPDDPYPVVIETADLHDTGPLKAKWNGIAR